MKIKYLISLCLIVLFLMSIASVSANDDANQTADSEILSASMSDDAIAVSNDENVISSNNRDWYVNASASAGGDGSNTTPYNNFKSVLNNSNLQNGDNVYFAGGKNYTGDGINVNLVIDKQLNLLKYGSGEAVFDAEHNSRIFYVTATGINITGLTFVNGNADKGGAIYFENAISNSNLDAMYINNNANMDGGANYFNQNVSNSKIGGTYENNTANRYGGANYFNQNVSNSKIGGTYTKNNAASSGGANYFNGEVLNSNITGTYENNTAKDGGANYFNGKVLNSNIDGTYTKNNAASSGGANYFRVSVSNSNITGTYINNAVSSNMGVTQFANTVSNSRISGIYINNTKTGSAICFYGTPTNVTISNAIFLNNKYNESMGVIYSKNNGVAADNNWFGNNATNYDTQPKTTNVEMNSWLFLNGTGNQKKAKFFLMSYDGTAISDYDNTLVGNVNLTISAADAIPDKDYALLNEEIPYRIIGPGNATITAQIEDVKQSINVKKGDFDLLQELINNAASSLINLERDYIYNEFDTITEGVLINKNVTINANGFTIDAKGKSRIFYVTAESINITNTTFKNGNAKNGGAIYFENALPNANINAAFINNSASYGGANYFCGDVTDSNITGRYTKNTASWAGGANYFYGAFTNSNITGTYTKNTVSWAGGANRFNSVTNSNITGTYYENEAQEGGANYFASITNSKINGTYENNTASWSGGANSFEGVTNSAITGTYINNTADNGGANSFLTFTKNSVISGTYANNKATKNVGYGGANYFNTVIDSTINGTYTNNTAKENAGANYFESIANSTINGTYENNTAQNAGANQLGSVTNSTITGTYSYNTAQNRGINYFTTVTNSTISGTYTSNTAQNGGINHFYWDVINSNITGRYINNTAENGGINHFYNSAINASINGTYIKNKAIVAYILWEAANTTISGRYINNSAGSNAIISIARPSNTNISNAIFLNNKYNEKSGIIQSNRYGITADNNWFGNNQTNYDSRPDVGEKIKMDAWLFLNATADPSSLLVCESSDILFKLYSYNCSGDKVSDYDNTKLPIVNLTLTAAKGEISNSTTLDESVEYTATKSGHGSVTATVENVECTVFLNNRFNYEFSVTVDPQEIDYGHETVILLDYNENATGTVNITLSGEQEYNYYYENMVLNRSITLPEIILPENYTIVVSYSGDETFKNATANTTLIINKLNPELSVEDSIIDYGETIKLIAHYNDNATGRANIFFKSETHRGDVWNEPLNHTIVIWFSLLPDVYNVSFEYFGSRIFKSTTVNATLTINKLDAELSVGAPAIRYGEDITLNLDYNENATGTDDIAIAGPGGHIFALNQTLNKTYTFDNKLKPGNYIVSMYYHGDEIFNESNIMDVKLTINKLNPELTAEVPKIKYGEYLTLNLDYNENATGTLNITLAGEREYNYYYENITLKRCITLPEIIYPENYTITVYYSGDEIFEAATANATTLINKLNPELSVEDAIIDYGEKIKLIVHYNANATGRADIFFKSKTHQGDVWNEPLNHTITIDFSLLPDVYNVSFEYFGTRIFESATVNATLTINKVNPELTVEVPKIKYGEYLTLNLDYNENATGTVNITLAGERQYNYYYENITLNRSITLPEIIYPENYTITVYYSGDEIFEAATANATTLINKLDPELSVEDAIIDYGETIKLIVHYNDNATGRADIFFKSKTHQGDVWNEPLNHTITIDFSLLPDVYNVSFEYFGTRIFESATVNATLTINKLDANEQNDVNGTSVTVKVDSNATGKITLAIGNETLASPVLDATAEFDLSDIPAGDYNATLTYSGDEIFNGFEKVIPISIEGKFILTADNLTKYYSGAERFSAKLTDAKGKGIENATISITLNGKAYNRTTDKNGQASIAINLNSGEYPVSVSYNGTSVDAAITVLATVNGSDVVKVYRNATQYYATFRDSEGNYLKEGTTVRFNINGVFYDRQISGDKGLARLNLNLEQESYILTATNPETGENAANNITILSRLTENRDVSKYYRNATPYTVKVIGDDGKAVSAGETVRFNINGVFYERTTDESGIAKLNLNLQPGDYIITAEYRNCRVSNNITVLPVLAAEDLTKKYGTKDQFVATLVDGKGNPYAEQSVTFNIHGVFYNRITDSSGQARLNINLQPGEYIITSSYNSANIANTIKVTA